ncbi:MAG: Hsp20/alpha crystallin family protein [Elusimicrobiales bacterium]|nr:Hsp20/alpha crystallin family protein [Elusimicrobiales bacterium]
MGDKDLATSKGWTDAAVRPFESLGRALEDLFDLPLTGPKAVNTPQMDIRETDSTIEVSLALSGVEKKDINLNLTENSLAISCERREEKEEKGSGGYRMKEQSYGRFYRAFTLPSAVKPGDATAVYKDGVLKITMNKQKTDKARQITVQ